MSQPLISILIPFKNTEAFISECVTSIISQTYTNWEAIFVDDHSDDASYTIVEKFSKNDNRIQLYNNKREGIISALQTAFSNSKGTYITKRPTYSTLIIKALCFGSILNNHKPVPFCQT